MAIKPITRYGRFTSTGVDETEARKLQALAGIGEKVTEAAVALGKIQTQKKIAVRQQEAELEGVQAAEKARVVDEETGEITYQPIELRSGAEYGDLQFNRAVAGTLKSQRDIDTRKKFSELEIEHETDPEMFDRKAQGYIDGIVAATPEVLRPQTRQQLMNSKLSKLSIIAENKRQADKEKAKDINRKAIAQGTSEVENLTLRGKDASQEVNNVKQSINTLTEVDNSVDASKLVNNLEKTESEAKIIRELNLKFEDKPESAYQYLLKLKKNIPAGYSADEWEKFTDDQRLRLNRLKNTQTQANANATAKNKRVFEGVLLTYSQGGNPTAEDADIAQSYANSTNNTTALDDAKQVGNFLTLPKVEQNNILERLEGKGGTNVVLLNKLKGAQQSLEKNLVDDPMGVALQQGVVTLEGFDSESFNVLNPSASELEQLQEFAGIASQHYFGSSTDFPILTKQQSDLLVKFFDSDEATATEKAILARNYGKISGVWRLFDKQKGVYGQAAAHENPDVTEKIFVGLERLKRPEYKVLGADRSDARDKFYNYVGEDTINDDDAYAMIDAAFAHFAGNISQNEKYSDDKFEESIVSVVGAVDDVRGFKTLLPTNVDADDFEAYFDEMTEEEYRKFAGNKPDDQIQKDLELIKEDGYFFGFFGEPTRIQAVPNGYNIVIGNGVITNAEGEPLIMNITREVIMNSEVGQRLADEQAARAEAQINLSRSRLSRF